MASAVRFRLPQGARWLYTHNPFYVISAASLLYGIHLSFSGSGDLANGWLLMRILAGYSMALAAIGVAIGRWGRVWEDVRTILLVLALLIVAMSASFDRMCLDSVGRGAGLLALGWTFAIALSEGVLRGLRVRLPARYRVPLYLQLLLLFAYPVWLGHLSITGQNERMFWYVFLFPSLAAVLILALLPAARAGAKRVRAGAAPWPWPWYPWTLFLFLLTGLAVRAYGLSVSFELSLGLESGFSLFFLVPLLVAASMNFLELARASGRAGLVRAALVAPLLLVLVAFPGHGASETQLRFARMLAGAVAGPTLLTLGVVAVFYGYACWRRVPGAATVGLAVLGMLCFVDRQTIDLRSLSFFEHVPVAVFCVLLVGTSAVRRVSPPLLVALAMLLGSLTYHGRNSWVVEYGGFFPVHLGLLGLLAVGALLDDRGARQIRRAAVWLVPAVCLAAVTVYPSVFARLSPSVHLSSAGFFSAAALVLWLRTGTAAQLGSSVTSFGVTTSGATVRWGLRLDRLAELDGAGYLAVAAGVLVLAVGLSLIKSGVLARAEGLVVRLNEQLTRRS